MQYVKFLSLFVALLAAWVPCCLLAQPTADMLERLQRQDPALAPCLKNADAAMLPLLDKTLDSASEELRHAALCGMEKLAATGYARSVVARVQDPAPRVRRKALTILGQWRQDDAAEAICARLQDSDKLVRATAVWALAEIAAARYQTHLTTALQDEAWEVRCAAWAALHRLPLDIPERFAAALRDPAWQVRTTAIQWAARVKADFAPALLRELFAGSEANVTVLASAADALSELGDASALPIMLSGLHHSSVQVRGACERAITRLAPACMDALVAVWLDSGQAAETRYQVGMVFGRLRARHLLPQVWAVASDDSSTGHVRHIALVLLSDWDGNKAAPLLRQSLSCRDLWVRRAAIAGVGQLRDEQALDQLWASLQNLADPLHEDIMWAVAQMPVAAVEPRIVAALANDACLPAIRLAGILRLEQARQSLRRLAQESNWRAQAQWALHEIDKVK